MCSLTAWQIWQDFLNRSNAPWPTGVLLLSQAQSHEGIKSSNEVEQTFFSLKNIFVKMVQPILLKIKHKSWDVKWLSNSHVLQILNIFICIYSMEYFDMFRNRVEFIINKIGVHSGFLKIWHFQSVKFTIT